MQTQSKEDLHKGSLKLLILFDESKRVLLSGWDANCASRVTLEEKKKKASTSELRVWTSLVLLDPVIYRIAFCPKYVNLQRVLYLFLSEWQPRILPAHGCTLGLGYYMNCNTLKPLNPRLRRADLHAQSPLSLFLSFTAGHEASLLPGVRLLATMWAGLCSPRTKVGAKRELVSLPEPPGS